jgi:thioredoxin-like negative regulator of GroEL
LNGHFVQESGGSFEFGSNTGSVQDVTSAWEIRAMPTFLFIKEGKQIDKIVGANKDELDRKVQHYASQSKS